MSQLFPISRSTIESSESSYAATLLSPSGVSFFLCIITGITLPLTTALLTHYNSNILKDQLAYWEATRYSDAAHSLAGASAEASHRAVTTTPATDIINLVSTILFWAVIGAISIVAVISIIKALSAIDTMKRTFNFVNQDRKATIRGAGISLFVSLLAVSSIIALTVISFKRIAMWSVEQTNHIMEKVPLTEAMLRVLGISLVIAGLLHLYVILIRLALLRTRVM